MKIASWNIEGRLSDLATDKRGTPEAIVAAIKRLDADILVHPEAFGNKPPMRPEITAALQELGYEHRAATYDDSIGRGSEAAVDDPYQMVLSRLPILKHEVIRPGGLRSMNVIYVRDPESGRELRVIGIHLEDREEAFRLEQVTALIEYINCSDIATVMMGDFNAMPPNTLKSRLIHSGLFKRVVSMIPHAHMRYVLKRLSDMASGTTIARILAETPLINSDPSFRPTTTPKMRKMEWMPSLRLVKIDWIFVSPDIGYKNFRISPDLGSDHRALSLEISLKNR